MYITICKIDDQWKFDLWSRAPRQSQCSVKTWTDRVRREVGSERRGQMYAYGQFMLKKRKKKKKIVKKKKKALLQPLSRWCTDEKPPHPTVTAEPWVLGHLDGWRFCGPLGWCFTPCQWLMPIFFCLVSGRRKEQWINTFITTFISYETVLVEINSLKYVPFPVRLTL